MKNKKIFLITSAILLVVAILQSCMTSRLAERSGNQLWGENCTRCHSTPPPNAFTNEQWETIGMHMRVRASLTEDEVNKIIEFLKSSN